MGDHSELQSDSILFLQQGIRMKSSVLFLLFLLVAGPVSAFWGDADSDGDGIKDSADEDDDNDGDGLPNKTDPDDDGDGTLDGDEDDDGDGVINRSDADDDNDGVLDENDEL